MTACCSSPAPARSTQKKVYELPEGGRAARGRSVANLLSLATDETLSAFPCRCRRISRASTYFSRRGAAWSKRRRWSNSTIFAASGIIAINLEDGDELIGVRITDGDQQIVLSTREGQAIRFKRRGSAADGARDLRRRRDGNREESRTARTSAWSRTRWCRLRRRARTKRC